LCFGQGAGALHIVYGDNEAGKSSSLRALRQWLYGIPQRSSDDFLHSHPNMRIGGVIENQHGQRLEFIRRKGQSKTIRAADDGEPIDEGRLLQMLAGVDEAAFRRRFGIDYPELRQGGEALVAGGGDLKEILFAAGAGIADLGRIQKRLEEEASALFKPRGLTQRLNQSIAELAEANREVKRSQLPSADWIACDKTLCDALDQQEAIAGGLREKRGRRSRLARLSEAAPLVARRVSLAEKLARLGDAPLLAPDFGVQRQKAATELANALQAEQEAIQEIERLERELQKLDAPTVLLEYEEEIDRLKTELGGYEKANRDKPGLREECAAKERRAVEILRDLGREMELEDAEAVRATRKQRERIQSLAGDYKRLQEKHTTCEKASRDLRRELDGAGRRLAELPATRDASDLARTIRQVLKRGEVDEQFAKLQKEHSELERELKIKLANLPLFAGALDQLEGLCTPSLESVDYHEGQIEEARSQQEDVANRLDELGRRSIAIEQELVRIEQESDVPTESDVAQARRQRDEKWRQVKQAWLTPDETGANSTAETDESDLASAYYESTLAADAIADRLRRESARVIEKARLVSELQACGRESVSLEKQLAAAQQDVTDAQLAWRAAWRAAGIEPLTPREMRAWLQQHAELARRAASLRSLAERAVEAKSAIESCRGQLAARLAALNEPVPDVDRIDLLVESCQAVVDRIEAANRDRKQCEDTLRTLAAKLSEAEENTGAAIGELEKWRSEWSAAVAALGLGARAEAADAALIDESLALLDAAGGLHERIRGIGRDAEEFTRSVRRMLAETAPDLLEAPVEQAVRQAHARLTRAKTQQTQRDEWNAQLQTEARKRDRARARIKAEGAKLDDLRRQAGCASIDDLPAAEQRSTQRREWEQQREGIEEQIAALAAGEDIEAWIEEIERSDPEKIAQDIAALDQDIAALDAQRDAVAESIGSSRARLAQMNGGDTAAEEQARAQRLLARVRTDAEQYLQLKLAGIVLARSMERYRKANQGPVLARASELFSELTLGSFDGLQADYNEQGDAVLVGIRGGKTVHVEGMSEGSCDQLYLSLRLALLESYLENHEPMPFVVDDILVMFDNDRSIAALKALARLAAKTQVIFFTHHEHLVQLARENLGEDELVAHTLNHRVAAPA
jgi:uncharacterized protein YhaN